MSRVGAKGRRSRNGTVSESPVNGAERWAGNFVTPASLHVLSLGARKLLLHRSNTLQRKLERIISSFLQFAFLKFSDLTWSLLVHLCHLGMLFWIRHCDIWYHCSANVQPTFSLDLRLKHFCLAFLVLLLLSSLLFLPVVQNKRTSI